MNGDRSAPVVVQHPSLHDRVEDLPGKELIAGPAVEALHEGVLPGRARGYALNQGSSADCGDLPSSRESSSVTCSSVSDVK